MHVIFIGFGGGVIFLSQFTFYLPTMAWFNDAYMHHDLIELNIYFVKIHKIYYPYLQNNWYRTMYLDIGWWILG